jgi:hypothetical protein
MSQLRRPIAAKRRDAAVAVSKQKLFHVAKEPLCRNSICDLYGHDENAFA